MDSRAVAAATATLVPVRLPRHKIGVDWRASSLDDGLGVLVAVVAMLLAMGTGGAHAFHQPVYGPIDEVSHTAYAFHVAKYGVPPVLGRDRAFIGRHGAPLGSRDVDIPQPEKASSPVPIGLNGVFGQPEAIQPPLYYYIVAPAAWFSQGTPAVIAMRLAGVLMVMISVLLAFVAVLELTGDALSAGFAAIVLATLNGITDFLSQVQNDALLLPLGGALFWLLWRGLQRRRLTWPLVLVAAALSITHVVTIPLAALAVVVLGVLEVRRTPAHLRGVLVKAVVAGLPLLAWLASNVVRYGSLFPHDVSAAPSPLFTHNNDQLLHLHELAYPVLNAIIGGAYLYIQASPYGADYRPLTILIPVVLIGTGLVCAFRPERMRRGLGYAYLMVGISVVTIFLSVAASLIGTGGDLAAMQIHRYYMPTYFAGACLAGIAAGGLSSTVWLRRTILLVLPLIMVYWALNGSSLT
jgi:hypothetical protein